MATAWSDRLPFAALVGVVAGLGIWRVALGAGATSGKAAATGAVVGLLIAANYALLALAARRNRGRDTEHPWTSALALVVPLAVILAALHYARGEVSLAGTVVSVVLLVVVGGVLWRFLHPPG